MSISKNVSPADDAESFSERLNTACDNNPNVPDKFKGRQSWIREQIEKRFNIKLTAESVSRWFNGGAKPRLKNVIKLAEILGVDTHWLNSGVQPTRTTREVRSRNATSDAAVNLVAGIISLDGGTPAFPDESGPVDLVAIVRGVSYRFHVTMADQAGGDLEFIVPAEAEALTIIGVVRMAGFSFRLFKLPVEIFEGTLTAKAKVTLSDIAPYEIQGFCNKF